MKKYRINRYGIYDHIYDVEIKKWYGWALIKRFKAKDIEPSSIEYANNLAKELLSKLDGKIIEHKQYLNIEQMEHLSKLGVNINKASFFISEDEYGEITISNRNSLQIKNAYPVFSLQDVLNILSKQVSGLELTIKYHEGKANVFYSLGQLTQTIDVNTSTLLESAYEILCLGIKNGFFKKEDIS